MKPRRMSVDRWSPRDSGFWHVQQFLSPAEQQALLEEARKVCAAAPLRRPSLPNGQPMKLTLTNCGKLGWWSDARGGYRYIDSQPGTAGKPWPDVPLLVYNLTARAFDAVGLAPMRIDNCLINHYSDGESLGLHVDRTELDQQAPIVSFSLGADAEFILQPPIGEKVSYVIRSGDLVVQSGPSRSWLHGIKRILPTLPNICRDGGRINFTVRKVLTHA